MIKAMKKRDEIHENEWESLLVHLENISNRLSYIEEDMRTLRLNLRELQDDIFDVVIKNEGVNKTGARGPYGPRKKKQLEHKKTPPEN